MGAYGRIWVRWGVGDMGNTKTKQRLGHKGLADPDLGPMAGYISPDIMFWEIGQKVTRVDVYGFTSI